MVKLTKEEEIELNTLFSSIFRQPLDKKQIDPIIRKYGLAKVMAVLKYLLERDRHVASPYGYIITLCKKW